MEIQIKSAVKCGYEIATENDSINLCFPDSETRRGRVGREMTQTLDCACNQGVIEPIQNFRVRKLTPLECYRLMGFDDEDFYFAAYGRDIPVPLAKRVEKRDLQKHEWKILWRVMRHQKISNSQLYKQAGNSIVVDVLMAIFKNLL